MNSSNQIQSPTTTGVITKILVALVIAAAGFFSACAGKSKPPLTTTESGQQTLGLGLAREIGGGHQCRLGDKAFAEWIPSNRALSQWQQRISRLTVLSPPPNIKIGNFRQQSVVLLYMGQQGSGGYALKLLPEPLKISGRIAHLKIEWLTPKPGMMQSQALTSPCLLIAIPNADYHAVEVVDQNAKTRFTLHRPN